MTKAAAEDRQLSAAQQFEAPAPLSDTDTAFSRIAVFTDPEGQPRRPGQPLTGYPPAFHGKEHRPYDVADTNYNHRRAAGIWLLIHAERAALAADLAQLTGQRWATQSLCDQFTVREVLAHVTAGASLNPVRWMAGVIHCRFDFDRQVAMRLAEHMGATPAETLARFRRVITSTAKPPLPIVAMLGETIVHGEDIRRPLGLERDYPVTALTALTTVADYYQGSDLPVLARRRVRGLRLTATDGPFTAGAGPRVSGTTLALVMAMAGRAPYCDELNGDGVAILRQRQPTADE